MEYKDSSRYIPIIYLLYSWGSRFGVPSRVPLGFGELVTLPFGVQGLGFNVQVLGPGLRV